MLAICAALAAMPAAASAKSTNPLAGAKLQSVTAKLTIKTSRCPTGVDQAANACGHADLASSFTSGPAPSTSAIASKGKKFPSGIRLTGAGQSRCTSQSATAEPVTEPGGMYDVGSAIHVANSSLDSTNLLVATGKRGARWAWTEPIAPSAPCNYFYGAGAVAVPSAVPEPSFVVSEWLPVSTLRRKTFGMTFGASRQFQTSASDGTVVYGDADWTLTLRYKR